MSQYTRFPSKETAENPARNPRENAYSRSVKQPVHDPDVADDVVLASEPAIDHQPSRTRPEFKTGSTVIVTLFLISLVLPLNVFVGSLLLNPVRLLLLVLFVPLVSKWASGQAGKIYGLDYVFLAFVLWTVITLLIAHGSAAIDLVGITTVETFGGFLVGRVYVQSRADFVRVVKVLTLIMLVLVPASVLEAFTGFRIFSEIADAIASTHTWIHADGTYEKRLGMYRAHTVFEHPILYGIFSATVFGLLYFSQRSGDRGIQGYRLSWLSLAGTFFSLSSGAIISLVAQMGFAFWDFTMRGVGKHWKILLILVAVGYVIVDLLSNRTPFEVFITYAAFSAHNGYIRIVIFTYGMETVWSHPILGIGQADWIRPNWLQASSVDNFWLLMGMRHGFPGFILIAWSMLGTTIRLAGLKLHDEQLRNIRYGVVFSLIGLALSMMTVHIWGVTYIFVCFLLGAGVWLRDVPQEEQKSENEISTGAVAQRGRPLPKT